MPRCFPLAAQPPSSSAASSPALKLGGRSFRAIDPYGNKNDIKDKSNVSKCKVGEERKSDTLAALLSFITRFTTAPRIWIPARFVRPGVSQCCGNQKGGNQKAPDPLSANRGLRFLKEG